MSSLKIFVRSRSTGKLYRNRRVWTDEPAKARTFDSALAACYFAADANLHDVEKVWLRKEGQTNEPVIATSANAAQVRGRSRHTASMAPLLGR